VRGTWCSHRYSNEGLQTERYTLVLRLPVNLSSPPKKGSGFGLSHRDLIPSVLRSDPEHLLKPPAIHSVPPMVAGNSTGEIPTLVSKSRRPPMALKTSRDEHPDTLPGWRACENPFHSISACSPTAPGIEIKVMINNGGGLSCLNRD